MERDYEKEIDTLISEYFNYKKSKEQIKINENNEFRWFPKTVYNKNNEYEITKEAEQKLMHDTEDIGEIAEQMRKEGLQASALSDNAAKILEPYAVLEVEKMDYDESPIYCELDAKTVSDMAESAYGNAVLNVSALNNANTIHLTREQLIYSLIKELIIKEIFFMRRVRWL